MGSQITEIRVLELSADKAKFREWRTRCVARGRPVRRRRYNGPRNASRATIDVKFWISAGD